MISVKYIEREQYLTKLIHVMGTPDIKMITGVRGSGKHQLLNLFHKYIMNHVDDANIIHINFNLKKYDYLKNVRIYIVLLMNIIKSIKVILYLLMKFRCVRSLKKQ